MRGVHECCSDHQSWRGYGEGLLKKPWNVEAPSPRHLCQVTMIAEQGGGHFHIDLWPLDIGGTVCPRPGCLRNDPITQANEGFNGKGTINLLEAAFYMQDIITLICCS